MNYKNNNDNCVRRTLTLKVMLSVLLIKQTGSRSRQHNYEFNGVLVNKTDEAWRHLPLAWQWKNLILNILSVYRSIPLVDFPYLLWIILKYTNRILNIMLVYWSIPLVDFPYFSGVCGSLPFGTDFVYSGDSVD